MPDLGSATYRLEIDASQFDRELAQAKAEAAAAARDINRSLSDLRVDAHVSQVNRVTDTHQSLFDRTKAGYSEVQSRIHGLRDSTNSDFGGGLSQLVTIGTKLKDTLGQASGAIRGMEQRVAGMTQRVTQSHQFGLSTTEAENQLMRMGRMLDRFYRDASNRAIMMDRDLSRRFGLSGGGTRGGLLSRLLGLTYAVPQGGPTGTSSAEAAMIASVAGMSMGGARGQASSGPAAGRSGGAVGGVAALGAAIAAAMRRNPPPSAQAAGLNWGPAALAAASRTSGGGMPPTSGSSAIAPPPPPPDRNSRATAIAWARRILWGTGAGGLAAMAGLGGMAAFGTVGSALGLGPEHIIGAGLAVGGTVAGAAAGGATLAAGAAGKFAVGAGSDMLVNRATIQNTQTLYKAQQNLNTAIATYGANSVAAATAQKQLNGAMNNLVQTVGPKAAKAELGLATAFGNLSDHFQHATANAQIASTKLFGDLIKVADAFVKPIADAALRNITIITKSLQPLFAWLKGPAGMGIFKTLENNFAKTLPTTIHAFTQGVELLLKIMAYASGKGGGFIAALDKFFTKWNSAGNWAPLKAHLDKWIYDFHLVVDILKTAVADIFQLVKAGSGEGQTLLQMFDHLLHKIHDWEVAHQGFLHSFLANRAAELIAFIKLGAALAGPVLQGIFAFYQALNPVVPVITSILKGITSLIQAAPALGAAFGAAVIAGHFGLLGPALGLLKGGGAAGGAGAVAAGALGTGASAGTSAGAGKVTRAGLVTMSPGAASTAASPSLWGRVTDATTAGVTAAKGWASSFKANLLPNLMQGGAIALAGVSLGQVLGHSIGGETGRYLQSSVGGAGIGAGLGSLFGPTGAIVGLFAGGLAGGLWRFLKDNAQRAGNEFAQKFTKDLGPLLPGSQLHYWQRKIADAKTAVNNAIDNQTVHHQAGRAAALLPANNPAANAAAVFDKKFNIGYITGQAGAAALANIKVPNAQGFLAEMTGRLKYLGPVARQEASKVMLEYAAGLVRSGKLPASEFNKILMGLTGQFGSFKNWVVKNGMDTASGWTSQLKLRDAKNTLSQSLNGLQGIFGGFHDKVHASGDNLVQVYGNDFIKLEALTTSKSKDIRTNALYEIGLLHDKAIDYFTKMGDHVASTMDTIGHKVHSASKLAADVGTTNFQAFADNVHAAMSRNVLSSGSGMQLIIDATNKALKALGQKPLQGVQIGAMTLNQGKTFQLTHTMATGGYIIGPGQTGPDDVNVWVGKGEAILNDKQQAMVNASLMKDGISGLPDVYERTKGSRHGRFAAGGYAGYSTPLPKGSMGGQWVLDQGVDISAGGGTPEYAIGPGTITAEGISGFGPDAPVLTISAGPLAGHSIYYGHAGPDLVPRGARVTAGQQISSVGFGRVGISTGPHIEIGFSDPSGNPLGTQTAPAMASLLHQLLAGAGVTGITVSGGGAAGVTVPHIGTPSVKGVGAFAKVVKAVFDKVAGGANAYLSKFGSAGSAGSSFSGTLSGPVPHQVAQFMSAAGFNKIAIAGMLGNAMQESSMNPNTPGGGLWQQITNFGSGTGGSLLAQMQRMLPQIENLKGAMNAAGSPGNAAVIFEQGFEHAGIIAMANRIAAANQAFAQGYSGGGYFSGGGDTGPVPTGSKPEKRSHHKLPVHRKQKGHKARDLRLTADFPNLIPDTGNAYNNLINNYGPWTTGLDNQYGRLGSIMAIPIVNPDGTTTQKVFLDPQDIGLVNTEKPTGLAELKDFDPKLYPDSDFPQIDPGMTHDQLNIYDWQIRDDWVKAAVLMNQQAAEGALKDLIVGDQSKPADYFQGVSGFPGASYFKGGALHARAARLEHINDVLSADDTHNKKLTALQRQLQLDLQGLTTGSLKDALAHAGSDARVQARINAALGTQNSLKGTTTTLQSALSAERALGPAGNQSYIQQLQTRINQNQAQGLGMATFIQQLRQDLNPPKWRTQAAQRALQENHIRNTLTGLGWQQTDLTTTMNTLGGGTTGPWTGGIAGLLVGQINDLTGANTSLLGDLQGFPDAINSLTVDVRSLQAAKAQAGLQTTTPGNANKDAIIANLQQLTDQANQAAWTLAMQMPVFQSVGGFATGTPYVPDTGYALIHQGEAIIPAESNPFAGKVSATSPPEVHIHGLGDFVDRVETVVDGKKQDIKNYINHDMAQGVRTRRLLPSVI